MILIITNKTLALLYFTRVSAYNPAVVSGIDAFVGESGVGPDDIAAVNFSGWFEDLGRRIQFPGVT